MTATQEATRLVTPRDVFLRHNPVDIELVLCGQSADATAVQFGCPNYVQFRHKAPGTVTFTEPPRDEGELRRATYVQHVLDEYAWIAGMDRSFSRFLAFDSFAPWVEENLMSCPLRHVPSEACDLAGSMHYFRLRRYAAGAYHLCTESVKAAVGVREALRWRDEFGSYWLARKLSDLQELYPDEWVRSGGCLLGAQGVRLEHNFLGVWSSTVDQKDFEMSPYEQNFLRIVNGRVERGRDIAEEVQNVDREYELGVAAIQRLHLDKEEEDEGLRRLGKVRQRRIAELFGLDNT